MQKPGAIPSLKCESWHTDPVVSFKSLPTVEEKPFSQHNLGWEGEKKKNQLQGQRTCSIVRVVQVCNQQVRFIIIIMLPWAQVSFLSDKQDKMFVLLNSGVFQLIVQRLHAELRRPYCQGGKRLAVMLTHFLSLILSLSHLPIHWLLSVYRRKHFSFHHTPT